MHTRDIFRQTLAGLADKARATLPASNGRIDAALKLVLSGDVELLSDGTALVGSCSDPGEKYQVNGVCPCRDFAQAPAGFCKHRLARALQMRCAQAMQKRLDAGQAPEPGQGRASPPSGGASVPVVPLPEAACSANVHVTIGGKDVLVTVRGHTLEEVLPQIEVIVQRYPVPASATTASEGEGKQCPKHHVPMRLNHGKDGKAWHSHKTPQGWCKGR